VLFMPAGQNPLKQSAPSTEAADRCAMVALAIADNPLFRLSRLDIERPPPSYTADLLQSLQSADQELFFLVGADILPELPRWRAPDEVLRLARLVVVNRPGSPDPNLDELERALPGTRERAQVLHIPGVDISAADIRARVRANQPIRYLTPPAVEQYIREKGLYLASPSGSGLNRAKRG
jgi:nicotinate-nucleotide adenylyltransferase